MLSAAVFAAEDITLNAGKDLLVYTAGGDNGKIAAALNIDSEELSSYISENNVEYFAVNKENTVQIKLTVNITEFSSSVSNLSNLSDGNIESLLPEITGIDGIRGEVLDKNGQKFAKIQLSSNDSGGDYSVTEYITAAQKNLSESTVYSGNGSEIITCRLRFLHLQIDIRTNQQTIQRLIFIKIKILLFTVIQGAIRAVRRIHAHHSEERFLGITYVTVIFQIRNDFA